MPSELPSTRLGARRWWPLAIAALVIVVVLAAVFMRRGAATAANPEDCETKPPPNAFGVAECGEGETPAAAKPGTAPPATPAKP